MERAHNRMDRVNELVRRVISNIFLFREIDDPRLDFITILSVDVSKDLQHAKVKYSILSQKKEDIDTVAALLQKHAGYVRKLVGQRVSIRYTPEIHFMFDRGLQHAALVDERLKEIKELKGDGHEAA